MWWKSTDIYSSYHSETKICKKADRHMIDVQTHRRATWNDNTLPLGCGRYKYGRKLIYHRYQAPLKPLRSGTIIWWIPTRNIWIRCILCEAKTKLYAYIAFVEINSSFPASDDFCRLLITIANSLDPDQAQQNIGPYLDPYCLACWWSP